MIIKNSSVHILKYLGVLFGICVCVCFFCFFFIFLFFFFWGGGALIPILCLRRVIITAMGNLKLPSQNLKFGIPKIEFKYYFYGITSNILIVKTCVTPEV